MPDSSETTRTDRKPTEHDQTERRAAPSGNAGPGPRWWYDLTTGNDRQTNAFIKSTDGVLTTLDVQDAAGGGKRTSRESVDYPDDNTSPNIPTRVYTSDGDVVAMMGKPSGTIVVEKGDGDHVNLVVHRALGVQSIRVKEVADIEQLGENGLSIKLELLDGRRQVVSTMVVRDETVRPSGAEPVIHQLRIADDNGAILASSTLDINNKNAVDRVGKVFPLDASRTVAEMEARGYVGPTHNSTGLDLSHLRQIDDKAYEQWFASGPSRIEENFERFKKDQDAARKAAAAAPPSARPENKGGQHAADPATPSTGEPTHAEGPSKAEQHGPDKGSAKHRPHPLKLPSHVQDKLRGIGGSPSYIITNHYYGSGQTDGTHGLPATPKDTTLTKH